MVGHPGGTCAERERLVLMRAHVSNDHGHGNLVAMVWTVIGDTRNPHQPAKRSNVATEAMAICANATPFVDYAPISPPK